MIIKPKGKILLGPHPLLRWEPIYGPLFEGPVTLPLCGSQRRFPHFAPHTIVRPDGGERRPFLCQEGAGH